MQEIECRTEGSLSQIYIYPNCMAKLGQLHHNGSTSLGKGSLPNSYFHHMKHTLEEGPSKVRGINQLNVYNSGS